MTIKQNLKNPAGAKHYKNYQQRQISFITNQNKIQNYSKNKK
jgi:hypothetical protein